jgi:hypothetical protein
MLPTQHDPQTHKHISHSLVLGRVGEYFQVACVLAPFSLTPMFSKTTSVFTTLYLELDNFFSFFLRTYELDYDLELLFDSFKLTFQCMPNFFARMVFLEWFLNTSKIAFTQKIL